MTAEMDFSLKMIVEMGCLIKSVVWKIISNKAFSNKAFLIDRVVKVANG